MPNKPLRPCKHPGCTELTRDTYCDMHKPMRDDSNRGNAYQRGYNKQWQRESKSFLQHNPLCAECVKVGRYTPATVVDHIKPHRGNKELFWDRLNWQGLCKRHHDQKTARGE